MTLPPQVITTARLRLAVLTEDDALPFRQAIDDNDAHLRPWIPFMAKEPRPLEETRLQMISILAEYQQGTNFRYGMRLKGDTELIGEVMLLGRAGKGRLEIGYWLNHRYGGQGYCGEAAQALVDEAFKLEGIEGVIGRCDKRNAPSNKVMERLGARLQKVEDEVDWNGETVTVNTWLIKTPGAPRGLKA